MPVLPPVFSSTLTSVITAAGSIAFTMSISASAATVTEVSASISTPVRSAVRTVVAISTAFSVTWRSTVTAWIAIGWHSGTRSGVRFAAWIPALRATASASPLATCPARSAAMASAGRTARPAPGRAHRTGQDRLPGRQWHRGQSLQGLQDGPDEQLEGDERADRVAGQGEDRCPVRAEDAEALRHAGLHGDLAERHIGVPRQRRFDRIVLAAHADAAAGDQQVGRRAEFFECGDHRD